MKLPKKEKYSLAIAGATGAVGQEMLAVLAKRNFPLENLRLLASKRSAGEKIPFQGKEYTVEELTKDSFKDIDIALFSAGGDQSLEFAPHAVASNCIVIDNSSAYRMDEKTPLVVPEINPDDLDHHQGIIANPNCTTIIAGMALWPIHQISKIKRIVICTYQAVSGAGAKAIGELKNQTNDYLAGKELKPEIFIHPIAFNLFSHDSGVDDLGYTTEEMKVVKETHKIFHDNSISISPTAIRVPVFRAHAEAIHLELENEVNLDEIHQALRNMSGVTIQDDREKNYFPMPLDVSGKDDVYVGRIRKDVSLKNGLNLFVCGDQILKGAALNAVQIAEKLIEKA
jgi:aspartate-semialdehyde dehydrogenase